MTCLVDDRYLVVNDSDLTELMQSIDLAETFSDPVLYDDVYSDHRYLQDNHPLVWAVLNTFWPTVVERYLETVWPDSEFEPSIFTLVEGHTPGNILWHTDRVRSDNSLYADIDIICLYYFDDLDVGALCLRRLGSDQEVKIYPRKGNIVLINETRFDIEHRIEPYDREKYRRHTARIGFKIKERP